MNNNVDTRRVVIFLGFAFGIAWLTGLVIYLTGGLKDSLMLAPGLPLALILLATLYMGAPALGNILTRLLTREGWKDMGLRPHFRKGWRYLAGRMVPAGADDRLWGGSVLFALPALFRCLPGAVKQHLPASPASTQPTLSPWTIVILQLLQLVLVVPLLNSFATFGEEFGWRAYLLPKLMPLGGRKAALLMGLIWGVWHWPVIFMGYEYGFDYPGYPWVGPLLFIWIAFVLGTFLNWLALRGRSVWPAVIGHAAINGVAGVAVFATAGQPNSLLGPLPVGILGSLGYALVAILIMVSSKALKPAEPAG